VDLSAHVPNSLAERNGPDPAPTDDVIWGCVRPVGMQSGNIGRFSVLAGSRVTRATSVTRTRGRLRAPGGQPQLGAGSAELPGEVLGRAGVKPVAEVVRHDESVCGAAHYHRPGRRMGLRPPLHLRNRTLPRP
jgi:hypothetical protein